MKNRLIPVIATLVLGFSTSAVAGDLNRLLSVKGMTCSACSAKVRNALTGVSGVKTAEVDLKSGQAKVIADPLVKLPRVSGQRRLRGWRVKPTDGRDWAQRVT